MRIERKLSHETRAKMALKKLGTFKTEETKNKIRNGLLAYWATIPYEATPEVDRESATKVITLKPYEK